MAHIKKIKAESSGRIKDIFNNVIGIGNGDADIEKSKTEKITAILKKFKVLYSTFDAIIKHYLSNDFGFEKEIKNIDAALGLKSYKELKKHSCLANIIKISNVLAPNKYFLEKNSLSFIKESGVYEYQIFPFNNFNIKGLYLTHDVSSHMDGVLCSCLFKSFTFGKDLYDVLSSPDIDVSQFKYIMMDAMEKIKVHPELHRCKDAFKVIEDSLDLFDNNFGSYYKDFAESGDNTIIMQNFINDIIGNESIKAKPRLIGQFNKIMNVYRKINAQRPKRNAKQDELFDFLGAHAENLKKAMDEDMSKGADKDNTERKNNDS